MVQLAHLEGLLVGPSAGAAVWSAIRLAESLTHANQPGHIVVVLGDRGDRYPAPVRT
jgi:cysteine synthase